MDELIEYLRNVGCVVSSNDHLEAAITHSSALGLAETRLAGKKSDCRSLAALGGSLLSAVHQKRLISENPTISMKDLARRNNGFICDKTLGTIAKIEGVDKWLIKGPSLKAESIPERAFSDLLCAIIGALFLDSGYESASLYSDYLIGRYADVLEITHESKSELQELVQSYGKHAESIQYVVTEYKNQGGAHSYTSTLMVLGYKICEGTGPNKKQSETAAAKNALTVAKSLLLSVLGK